MKNGPNKFMAMVTCSVGLLLCVPPVFALAPIGTVSRHLKATAVLNNNHYQQQQHLYQWRHFDGRRSMTSFNSLFGGGRRHNHNHHDQRQQRQQTLLSSSAVEESSGTDNKNKSSTTTNVWTGQHIATVGWLVSVSTFIIMNYTSKIGCWPTGFPSLLPRSGWCLMHALSGMVFSGTILATTVLEWFVVGSNRPDILRFWFGTVGRMESWLVLPALTGSILSGVAQAYIDYGNHIVSIRQAPKHVKSLVHLLFVSGAWWGHTDHKSQRQSQKALAEWKDDVDKQVPLVLLKRRVSNLVSCVLVLIMYGVMVLKPGYNPSMWQ